MCATLFLMRGTLSPSRSAKRRGHPWERERDDLDDVADKLGGEAILAAMIVRQAANDLHDLRAGKSPGEKAWPVLGPWSAYSQAPFAELHTFFAGEWFAFLSEHIGQDPAALVRVIRL